ncbi:CREB-binding protein [Blattella germanica]|nr:CREB-binding protein [Blattella germanica]
MDGDSPSGGNAYNMLWTEIFRMARGIALAIKKDQFKEMKNDHLELEPFVECQDCGRKLHQICVLHMETIWPQG